MSSSGIYKILLRFSPCTIRWSLSSLKVAVVLGSGDFSLVRIRLKSYDHKLLDYSAVKIVDTAKKAGLLEKYGVEWGGNCWVSFKDGPHWQIKGADKVAFK